MPYKKKKKLAHRHKWSFEFEDCSRCGGGEIAFCECGEYGIVEYKGKTRRRKVTI